VAIEKSAASWRTSQPSSSGSWSQPSQAAVGGESILEQLAVANPANHDTRPPVLSRQRAQLLEVERNLSTSGASEEWTTVLSAELCSRERLDGLLQDCAHRAA